MKKEVKRNKIQRDYTRQVPNPEDFQRFDLSGGNPWFRDLIDEWVRELPLDTLIHFPDNFSRVKALLADWLGVPSDMLFINNGSDSIIELLPRVFLKSDASVVVPVPTFFRFIQASERNCNNVIKVRFGNNFVWTPAFLERFLTSVNDPSVKLAWLASPNNPTGLCIPPAMLKEVLRTGKLVVLDRALNGFAPDLRKDTYLLEEYPNLIILSSFSKNFGLAGLRFGFSLASPSNTQKLREYSLPFTVSGPSLWFMERFLHCLVQGVVSGEDSASIESSRLELENSLRTIPGLEVVSGSQANFLMFRHSMEPDLFGRLKDSGILVADLNNTSGIEGEGFVRMTIRSVSENRKFVEKLKEIVG
ncbi:aminotransferase class I/II-fold pyridoxal phosphate-dependent enzyme [candidate division WWE3 bacterium]|nr:aminotransferase class I/II-fold pyridoxal phosphate-dependent enzyme [candidate division WWE3 bacterium]